MLSTSKTNNQSIQLISCLIVLMTTGISIAQNKIDVPKYTVLKNETLHPFKRSVDIRIPTRYMRSQLRVLAEEIKNKDKKKYDRTFILYYLPGMKVDEGAWASTHYNPNLEIEIYGLSAKEYKILTSIPKDSNLSVETIGRWIGSYELIEIMLEDGAYILRQTYPDRSFSESKLNKKETTEQTGYYEVDSSYGKYFVITIDENLSIFDKDGLIDTISKIE